MMESYDKTNPQSIEAYAQKLIGKSFRDLIKADTSSYSSLRSDDDKKNKGNLGQIVEERFFHYSCNGDSSADFSEAGVELKVSPFKVSDSGKLTAKERLILTMIDYCSVVNEEFETSHLWNKCKTILLVYYLYSKDITYNIDYTIKYASLFTPPEQDLLIIKNDYDIIVEKIREGKAHELSEGDTMYLSAATKAADSSVRRKQPYSDELAKPRAFAFKNSYMTYVLNNYICNRNVSDESIISGDAVYSFENYVRSKIDAFSGYTIDEICEKVNVDIRKETKSLEAILAYRILGLKGNKASELEKANIVIKTIRIGKNNSIKESMSFPPFRFTELIKEEWDESFLENYLEQSRFMFVVYKFNEQDELVLKGCQFWHIPYKDLQVEVRSVWERTIKVIREGLVVTEHNGIRRNNFPKKTENRVCHVRPHGANAADTFPLPNGGEYTKQSFWLNNTYILSQLENRFFED